MQKNRRKIFLGFLAIIVLLAGFIITITVRDKIQSGAIRHIDAFNSRYEQLKPFISGEDEEAASKQADITALLDELNAFGKKSFGFAAARAYCMSADIYWEQKKWAEAETSWLNAAKAAGKGYLAPVAFFGAAAAADEQGNTESAIEFYNKALNYGNVFPGAARAQFSVGRLEESRGNSDAALQAYRSLTSKWPDDPIWTNLAQSRIMVLSD
jgi:tetratricopeptide (TPR) repeat protein